MFAQFVLFLVIGAMLYTFYQHTPLPRPLARTDEVLPLFVVTSLPQGISGFIVAAIVAAALSPSINSLAATTVNDFYFEVRPARRRRAHVDARRAARDDRLGHRADCRRARRAVRDAIGARLRVVRAVAGGRSGARRIPDRRAHDARVGSGAMLGGMARRRGRAGVGLDDRRVRLDVVRAHRRRGDSGRRAAVLAACRAAPDARPV